MGWVGHPQMVNPHVRNKNMLWPWVINPRFSDTPQLDIVGDVYIYIYIHTYVSHYIPTNIPSRPWPYLFVAKSPISISIVIPLKWMVTFPLNPTKSRGKSPFSLLGYIPSHSWIRDGSKPTAIFRGINIHQLWLWVLFGHHAFDHCKKNKTCCSAPFRYILTYFQWSTPSGSNASPLLPSYKINQKPLENVDEIINHPKNAIHLHVSTKPIVLLSWRYSCGYSGK